MVYPMGLPHPNEPKYIKQRIRQLKQVMCVDNEIDCDKVVIWSNNELPRYLWDHWSIELRRRGYSWQKFLKALKLATGDIILWALKDTLTWEELTRRISSVLEAYSRGVE